MKLPLKGVGGKNVQKSVHIKKPIDFQAVMIYSLYNRNLPETGYAMAKFGTVALTRSFTQKGKDGPWKKDGVKAMALCPFFANTKLVTSRISLDKLEKQYKAEGKGTPLQMRVLETPEVNRAVIKL